MLYVFTNVPNIKLMADFKPFLTYVFFNLNMPICSYLGNNQVIFFKFIECFYKAKYFHSIGVSGFSTLRNRKVYDFLSSWSKMSRSSIPPCDPDCRSARLYQVPSLPPLFLISSSKLLCSQRQALFATGNRNFFLNFVIATFRHKLDFCQPETFLNLLEGISAK